MIDPASCPCVICTAPDVELGTFDQRVVANVERCGWSVALIPEDETGPGWAFTIGLRHSVGSPEVAMFGLDLDLMHECLNTVAGAVAAGRPLSPGQERDDVLEDLLVVINPVHESWHKPLFGAALWFYRQRPQPFMEMVWPDGYGRFPWSEDCSPSIQELQPLLWIPKSEHTPGPWTRLP
ncbi:DUF4262 domain-containing protein [Microtetraspora malaysiensis]|uniref:DUF4262 domain-containing protein n=1 Tax=Microtetraspora malaysiensis TaxID=161358 RepID=A0ABW6SY27_9ACTN